MIKNKQDGFTLVELMIVLLLSAGILATMAVLYQNLQASYIVQEETAEMQQEARIGLEIMSRELRLAGHVENRLTVAPGASPIAGILVAGPGQIQFTMDITDNPGTGGPDGDVADANESLGYILAADVNGDGIADGGGVTQLNRLSGAGVQQLVNNVHAIGFAYAYDLLTDADTLIDLNPISGQVAWSVPDGAGNWVPLDTDNNGIIDQNDNLPAATGLANATQLREIRAVQIWLLIRSSRIDTDFVDTATVYKVGFNRIVSPNDSFRRRLLVTNIRCRNLGLLGVQ